MTEHDKRKLDTILEKLDDLQNSLDALKTPQKSSSSPTKLHDGLAEITRRISETEAGKQAALLHAQGLSYWQISLQLCPERNHIGHHCGRRCATRLRQAAKPYLSSQPSEQQK